MSNLKKLCKDLRSGDLICIGSRTYTLEVADTFFTRFFGLMGRKSLGEDKALLIRPCNSIHTFFMRFNMTAVFVDEDMRVIKVVPNMSPCRLAFAPKAYAVLEFYGDCGSDAKVGDVLSEVFRPQKRSTPSPEETTAPVPKNWQEKICYL